MERSKPNLNVNTNTQKFSRQNTINSPMTVKKKQNEINSPLEIKSAIVKTSSFKSKTSNIITIQDFDIIKIIGTGNFGEVFLGKLKNQKNQYYAIKKLNKLKIYEEGQLEYIISEKSLLQSLDHPLIINLRFAFHDNIFYYLIQDYIPGGELHDRISKNGPLEAKEVKFYAASLILVIQHLHQNKVIYRDLKPENVILDEDGYIKLIDFGLSKKLNNIGRCFTLCGTPEYFAPEQIDRNDGEGYTSYIDYWALGNLIYELLAGKPAFTGNDPMEIYEKILKGIEKFPNNADREAQDLINGILQPKLDQRLGALDEGESIKSHPWFKNINYDKLLKKQVLPPWIPPITSRSDTQFFKKNIKSQIDMRELPSEYNELFDF